MTLDFNALRRAYYKARDRHQQMRGEGGYQANYSWERGEPLEADFDAPREPMWDFAAAMRPFLTPSSELRVENLVVELENLRPDISEESVRIAQRTLESLGSGPQITYNGEELGPSEVFETVSEGGVLQRDEAVAARLRRMLDTPLGPVLWFGFFSYIEDVFTLVQHIYRTIGEEGPVIPRPRGPRPLEEQEFRCIYCTEAERDFESEEHYLPESLGNYFHVLPHGYVCDQCNSTVLSRLDQSLAEFGPTALRRIATIPYTKDGTLPSVEIGPITAERTQPLHVEIEFADDREPEEVGTWIEGLGAFREELLQHSSPPRTIGRALAKVALGFIAYNRGHRSALDDRFDPLREFILEDADFEASYLILPARKPSWRLELQQVANEGAPVYVDLYGTEFLVPVVERGILDRSRVYTELGEGYKKTPAWAVSMHESASWPGIVEDD